MKVLIATKTTVDNDKRTLTEAEILSDAGLRVVIIGLLRANQKPLEYRDGFCVKRIRTSLKPVGVFKNPLLSCINKSLRSLVIYTRLFKALIVEKADYYHTHSSFLLMLITWAVAKLKRSMLFPDFNDILLHFDSACLDPDTYYNQDRLWGNALSEDEEERAQKTRGTIRQLQGIHTILDVGCGDGRVSNILKNEYYVVSMDISEAALRHVRPPKISGSIEHTPFGDRAFDMVMSTDVLEHLQNSVYSRAIAELKRVTRRFLLIGVPFNQQLNLGLCRCLHCGNHFHVSQHKRRFTLKKLKRLFYPDFRLKDYYECGAVRQCYHPVLLWLRQQIGGLYAHTATTICPDCGASFRAFTGYLENNAIIRCCNRTSAAVKKHKRLSKSEIIAVYERVRN